MQLTVHLFVLLLLCSAYVMPIHSYDCDPCKCFLKRRLIHCAKRKLRTFPRLEYVPRGFKLDLRYNNIRNIPPSAELNRFSLIDIRENPIRCYDSNDTIVVQDTCATSITSTQVVTKGK